MTILPKKKQNKNSSQNTNDEEREHSKDISSDRYSYSNSGQNAGGQMSPSGRSWSSRSSEVDKRPTPENGHASMGPSHSKRRHRTARERDVQINTDSIQRSLINSVRSINKSSLNSPPHNSPRNSPEIDLAIPGCSSGRDDPNEQCHPASLLVPVNFNNANNEDEEDFSGYNSGDEYQKTNEHLSNIDWEEKERLFERIIRKKGFIIKKMSEDGACLFRAVADQVYGDQEMHSAVRKLCMDYMEKNGDYFSQYVTENFTDYIQRKRSDHIHGNHIEIQALSEIFNRPIQVYHYSAEPINIENCQKTDNEPIRLSYHRNVHYNSIVNPYKATIGVGLGLPAFKPGIADKSLMEKALLISEQHELEQTMLEDKIRATDWEATNEAIEEQIARESYIEWLRDNERRSRTKTTASSTLTTNMNDDQHDQHATNSMASNLAPRCYSPRSSKSSSLINDLRLSPKRCNQTNQNQNNNNKNNSTEIINIENNTNNNNSTRSPTLIQNINATSSFIHEVPASVFGLNDWEDTTDPIIAQVLAQSQAEYLDSLKRSTKTTTQTSNFSLSESTSTRTGESNADDNEERLLGFLSTPSTSSKHF